MLSLKFWFLVASCGVSIAAVNGVKKEKAFSLFNVVTFKNDECIANAANDLRGTCYTNEECEERGGTASGGCAMGFGTCCLFTVDECGGTAKENCTYIRNADWPNALTGEPDSLTCDFTINKCVEEVCSLRLDFNTFDIQAGTGGTTGAGGAQDTTSACQDTFAVTTSSNNDLGIPVICGRNSDQHIFVEIGSDVSAELNFAFAMASATRQFEIKVTQYKCEDVGTLAPPGGCLQWHIGVTGQLTTFNWAQADGQHLQNQNYDICIRQEKGFCCTEYSVCAGEAMGFSLSVPTDSLMVPAMAVGATAELCTMDHIIIDGSSEICGSAIVNNKYCGDVLSSNRAAVVMPAVDNIICDCSSPFVVGIVTNAAADGEDETATGNLQQSRGLCLDYKQKPC